MNTHQSFSRTWLYGLVLGLGGILAACGDEFPSGPDSAGGDRVLFAFTPPADGRFCKALEADGGYYRIRKGTSGVDFHILKDGVETVVSTGLDVVRAAAVGEGSDGDCRLVLAGCTGSQGRVVVYEDDDDDGLIDDEVGDSDLPTGVVPEHLAVSYDDDVFFLRCLSGGQLLRSEDTDDDHIPDTTWSEFVPSTHTLDSDHDFVIIKSDTHVIVRASPPFRPDDEVTVLIDTDDDGEADSITVDGDLDLHPMFPRLRYAPRVQDLTFALRGSPDTTVEMYEVDSAGATIGAVLGSATLDSSGEGSITLATARSLGTFLRVKDDTNDLWAEVWEEVVANYPRLTSATPKDFTESVGGTLTVTGSGFLSAASFEVDMIELGDDTIEEDLSITVVNDTTLTTTIPSTITIPAGDDYSAWRMIIASTTAGHAAMAVDVTIVPAP